MNKQSITFSANEQTLEKTGGIDNYASNIISYVESTFTLGENWTGYDVVRAVWESAYAKISTVLDSDHKCVVPAEVLRHKSKVNVNLVGSIVTNDVLTDRLTTYPVHAITVDADARVDSTETQPITPSQFEQFVEAVHADAESIQDYSYDSEAWAKGTRGGVAVPSTDPTYHNNSKYYADQGAELEQEVSDLKSDFNKIAETQLTPTAFDSVEEGYVYNTSNTGGVSWSGGHSYIKAVSEGEAYAISTTILGSGSRAYWAVLLYNNTTYVSGVYQGASDSETVITDYEFVIPSGVNKIIVSTLTQVTPTLKIATVIAKSNFLANNYVKFDGTTLYFKGRYNSSEDLVVSMKKKGNNTLFDFYQIFATSRSDVLNGDITAVRTLLTSNTDCFSPHQMYAINNADGDAPSGYFLTGGNHDRNGVPTAYCDNLNVWVDGKKVTNFSGLCNHIKVYWENHIQGFNTWKADGSGRVIMTEKITLNIEGLKVNAVVEQIPTEDLYQSVYYGLMSINTPYPKLRFVGGSNRAEVSTSANDVNSGDLNCRRVIAYNTTNGDVLESYIENEDLGTFALTGRSYSAFTGNNKLYYTIIEPSSKRMNQGQLFSLRGYYNLSSMA